MKVHIFGNCQAGVIEEQMRMLLPEAQISSETARGTAIDPPECDVLFLQKPFADRVTPQIPASVRTILWPSIVFAGFHPDIVTLPNLASPTGGWHSAIALRAFQLGLSLEATLSLYQADVFEHLNFRKMFDISLKHLRSSLEDVGFSSEKYVPRWLATGCFMHGVNHPKRLVTEDLAVEMVRLLGLTPDDHAMRNFGIDRLAYSSVWSVYPWVSEALGLGKGRFIYRNAITAAVRGGHVFDLEGFVAESFRLYAAAPEAALRCDRLQHPQFQSLGDFLNRPRRRASNAAHPYRDLPKQQFWKHGVAAPARGEVDPVVAAKFPVGRDDRIATAGSCFAQHIARTLVASGFNYLVTETAPQGMGAAEAEARQFGLFSARFGNIYTPRQLVQLFDRAFGRFTPEEGVWSGSGGGYVDPFRPTIEPLGFGSEAALEAARQVHFAAVREMFQSLDVFVFTLGLTEGWRARGDGAVFPLAPGVSGGAMDPARHEFVNFSVGEVRADLAGIWQRLRTVNPSARMILTVSPVPLVATYEPRHVLVSTIASKSILRTAVEEISRTEADIAYFPSYELITGPHAGGAYFEADLRSVRPEGVEHAMGLFRRHYLEQVPVSPRAAASSSIEPALEAELASETARMLGVVCDEERLSPESSV